MATADELAADALEVANKFLAEQRQRLVEQAAGDLGLLAVAARIVQEEVPNRSPSVHGGEHLAFTLLTAAYEAIRTSR